MARLKLADVTLVLCETREHKLAAMALNDCVNSVDFADVLLLTNRPRQYSKIFHKHLHLVPNWSDKLGWCRTMWFEVPYLVHTKFMLCIQWDSWVWDVSMWRDVFLAYDFIGAPWWYKDGKNVGNSGFCLKSTAVARYIADRPDKFPCTTDLEDDLLCRKYRPVLEDAGFRWAPEALAHEFAFECNRPSKTSRHFGFHAMFNWPEVLDHERLLTRVAIALNSPYIRGSYMAKAFCERHPKIIEELLDLNAVRRTEG